MAQLKYRFEPSYYLYFDTFANARLRARFRLDRIGNNSQMFRMNQGKHGTTHTPSCVVCPNQDETITHMIEECPLYALPRSILRFLIRSTRWTVTTPYVLGSFIAEIDWTEKSRRGPTRLALQHSAAFLRSICRLRGLAVLWLYCLTNFPILFPKSRSLASSLSVLFVCYFFPSLDCKNLSHIVHVSLESFPSSFQHNSYFGLCPHGRSSEWLWMSVVV